MSEAAELVEKAEATGGCMMFLKKAAVPLVVGFYIFIAVLKTMLTYVLFHEGNSNPVGFSAVSAVATCLALVPVFVMYNSEWAVPSMKILPGFCLVCSLVALDLAFNNIAISMLDVAVQQCILATNPAFVVAIESIVNRKIFHPVIYGLIVFLCIGPLLTTIGSPAGESPIAGILIQIAGVTCSACKSVFAHKVMSECKKELGSFSFLFWIDTLILVILVPWSVANGELVKLLKSPQDALDWVNLWLTAFLGGVRFFSQLLVLRFTTPTTLACSSVAFQAINIYLSLALFGKPPLTAWLVLGSLVTLGSAGTYAGLKITKVLEKNVGCKKIQEDFEDCCGCGKDKI